MLRQRVSYLAIAEALFDEIVEKGKIKTVHETLYRSFMAALREFVQIYHYVEHARVTPEIIEDCGVGSYRCPCSGAGCGFNNVCLGDECTHNHVGPIIRVLLLNFSFFFLLIKLSRQEMLFSRLVV